MKNIKEIVIIIVLGLFVVSCNNSNPFNYEDADLNQLQDSFIENEMMENASLGRSGDSNIEKLDDGEEWEINDLRSGFNPKNGCTGTDDSTNVSIEP